MRVKAFLPIALLLGLGACAADEVGMTGSDRADQPSVSIEAIAFEPGRIEVSVGDTVTWTNNDSSVKHTVTSGKAGDRGVPGLDAGKPDRPDGLFDGSLGAAGDRFAFTFDEAGTITYFCRVHPVMTGRVVVTN